MFKVVRNRRSVVAILGCFALMSPAMVAQSTTGAVVGTIRDTTGAVVPGATVTITNLNTHVRASMQSNQVGEYTFDLLQPGQYSVTVEAPGFRKELFPGIGLAAGDRTREDASLQLGAADQQVTVNGEASLLQTDTSTVSSVVTEESVQNLPLNGRNYISLVTIQPGVTAGPPGAISSGQRPDNRAQSSTVSANGQNDVFNNEMIDGIDNNERNQGFTEVRPSIDAIAEVKVDTNVMDASVGRTAGAVVNVITKGGTDSYHGTLYEFFRNDIFDARDFFARAGVTNKPEYRQNQFGGSIGGPIKKGKTFFFADAEEYRIVQGKSSGLLTVPTLFEEQNPGNFSDINGPVVPTASLDPVGLSYFKLFPAPNVPGAGAVNNYASAPPTVQNSLSLDGRIDQHFINGDTFYGRYSYNNVMTNVPTPFPEVSVDGVSVFPGGGNYGFFGPSSTKAHGVQFNYIHPFSKSLLLQLQAAYTRLDIDTNNPNTGNISSAFGLVNANTPVAPATGGLTPVNFLSGGYTDLGDSPYIPILDVNNTFQYLGSVTYTVRAHTLHIGAGLLRRQLNFFQSSYPLGYVNFAAKTGNSLEDLLTGNAQGYNRGNELIKPGNRSWEPDAYIQDDWRVTNRLTLNLGFRYDIFTAQTEAHNRQANFNYPTLTLITADTDPHIGINTNYKNFAPRIGFALSLDKSTAIHGGFGIAYYPSVYGGAIQVANPPYQYANTCQPCAPFWPVLPAPVPSSTTNLSGNLTYVAKDTNALSLQQFNLFVQHEIGANVISIGYVGDIGHHLPYGTTINIPAPSGPYPNVALVGPPPPQSLLTASTLPNVSTIGASLPAGYSNYNSLQAVFARRFTRGLAFNANYTWAHGLGNTDGSSNSQEVHGLIATLPSYDYGNSSLDISQRFAANFTYDLPFGQSAKGFSALLIKGWGANFIGYWQTGVPFTIGDSYQNPNGLAQINLPDVGTDRPDRMPGASIQPSHKGLTEFFNVQAFTPQAPGTPGNERENALFGPHSRRADLALSKQVKIRELATVQFRAECFNISNTPNFSTPSNTISGWVTPSGGPIPSTGLLPGDISTAAGGFGSITSTVAGINPRQFQFALKILF